MTTVERALDIAREAHAGQVDRAGRPYIEHVLRVVDAVKGDDAKVVAALHDVLEDCPEWTGQRLLNEGFDKELIDAVIDLTRLSGISYESYIAAYTHIDLFRTVKLADLRDNADPARLALLPARDRERLSRKYTAAIAQLEAAP